MSPTRSAAWAWPNLHVAPFRIPINRIQVRRGRRSSLQFSCWSITFTSVSESDAYCVKANPIDGVVSNLLLDEMVMAAKKCVAGYMVCTNARPVDATSRRRPALRGQSGYHILEYVRRRPSCLLADAALSGVQRNRRNRPQSHTAAEHIWPRWRGHAHAIKGSTRAVSGLGGTNEARIERLHAGKGTPTEMLADGGWLCAVKHAPQDNRYGSYGLWADHPGPAWPSEIIDASVPDST